MVEKGVVDAWEAAEAREVASMVAGRVVAEEMVQVVEG